MKRLLVLLVSVLALVMVATQAGAAPPPHDVGPPVVTIIPPQGPLAPGCVETGPLTATIGSLTTGGRALIVASPGVTCQPGRGYKVVRLLGARYTIGLKSFPISGQRWSAGTDAVGPGTMTVACGAVAGATLWQGVAVYTITSSRTGALLSHTRVLTSASVRCP